MVRQGLSEEVSLSRDPSEDWKQVMQSLEQSFPGRGNGMPSYLRVNQVRRAEIYRMAGGKRKSEWYDVRLEWVAKVT